MTDDPAEYLLFADRVHKTYPDGKVRALTGVSLGVRMGESVAITGPSGCGKSTLLNLLGALDRPDSGEVYFRGEPLSKRRDLDRFRARQIGFVFQSFFLLPTLTARENVQVPMFEGPPLSAHARAKKAESLLELVGMSGRAGHRPAQLSVGERQRVALARALANDPVLLLADEPTGNLDSENAARVLDLLATLRQDRKLALLVVTHSPDVALRADRVVRMKDGQVLLDGVAAAAVATRRESVSS
ncbi:ABC transporter ATP-binding protein [Fimbriiglobus ruber]|uniref:Lipoprotein releasing system ATP-binding protein LolD n=1 Tax=Fimbriiglobus ruber TaxID=1908690 RepID=A0A225DD15_9BACT|nr:ABC transporter ATP-binding protein [Fimbriiglobus ruber]OWK39372.1 Lipoprotein releasing system ATP-binding protein LolD [Fimbriiglobus ruber]